MRICYPGEPQHSPAQPSSAQETPGTPTDKQWKSSVCMKFNFETIANCMGSKHFVQLVTHTRNEKENEFQRATKGRSVRGVRPYIYIKIYTYLYNIFIYIYTYTQRERERERERSLFI